MENLIETINDWINTNPTFKKKFQVIDLKKINNDGIQIDVSPTTKVNLNNLKKYLPSFLKLINQSISNVIIGNLYPEYDFEEFFKKYLKSIGLKDNEYSITTQKITDKVQNINIVIDIDIYRLLMLDDFNIESSNFFGTYLPSELRPLLSLKVEFTPKLLNSVQSLNDEMIEYIKENTNLSDPLELIQLNPTLAFFKHNPKHIDVLINVDTSSGLRVNLGSIFSKSKPTSLDEYSLRRVLKPFFGNLGLGVNIQGKIDDDVYSGWSTYRRGPWIDPNNFTPYSIIE